MSIKISKEELEEIDEEILKPLFKKWVKENKVNPEKTEEMKEDLVGLIDVLFWHGHDAGYDDGYDMAYEDFEDAALEQEED